MDLELNLLGLSIVPSRVPSRLPCYREVVIMESLGVIMRAVAVAVALPLKVVADTPGCQLGLPGGGGQLGLQLQIKLFCWGQPASFLQFRSLRAFLGFPGRVILKPPDNDPFLGFLF